MYRTLPFFFIAGAAIEWFMINVRVGRETFCKFGDHYPLYPTACIQFGSSRFFPTTITDDTVLRKEAERRHKKLQDRVASVDTDPAELKDSAPSTSTPSSSR